MRKLLFAGVLFLMCNVMANAQSTNLQLGRDDYNWVEHIIISTGKIPENFNPTLKGYSRQNVVDFLLAVDSTETKNSKLYDKNIQSIYNDNLEYAEDRADAESTYPILKSIYKYKTDFYLYNDHNFVVKLNPVINYQVGKSSFNTANRFNNSRGVEVSGNISNKIGFYSYFTDNQINSPEYVKSYIAKNYAVPGMGYYKVFKNDPTKQDFLDARGYITFSATKFVHFTFGQDRNFIGDGIRSLFLSDNANSTPFLKVSTHYKKFDYQNLYLQLTRQWLDNHYDKLLDRKYAVMHHLSYNALPNLQFGLFESVIFARGNQGYEFGYLNPIIFYRSVEQSLGSSDNASMGTDMKYIFAKKIQLYGQFYLDEFKFSYFTANKKAWTNKYAMQAGIKWIDFLGINNLDVQGEANIIRPFTYSHHDTVGLGNYSSYNQILAHPNGANLKELVAKIYYQANSRFSFTVYFSNILQGLDSLKGKYMWGGNPLISYNNRISRNMGDGGDGKYPYPIGVGVKSITMMADFTLSYKLMHNCFIDFHGIYRNQKSDYAAYNKSENYFGIGFRLNATRIKHLF
ncbi:MAG: hypothetical protein RL065_1579 [Bacteroidota bacterium]|jgi:hypothetical protein